MKKRGSVLSPLPLIYLGMLSNALGSIVGSWLNLADLCLPILFGRFKKDLEAIMAEAFLSSTGRGTWCVSKQYLGPEEGMFVWPGWTVGKRESLVEEEPLTSVPPLPAFRGLKKDITHFFFPKSER